MKEIFMKNVLVIMGGGLNKRFNTDIPKYLLPTKKFDMVLTELLHGAHGFDETVLIINSVQEDLWNIKRYLKKKYPELKTIVLNKPTSSPTETIFVSGVLSRYPKDRLFFKDCDTTFNCCPIESYKGAETFVVKKFGFQVNKRYSIVLKNSVVVEKPKIPWYKWLCLYNANIGCYVFPPSSLRPLLFLKDPSCGVICGKLKCRMRKVKKYKNYENLSKYGALIK